MQFESTLSPAHAFIATWGLAPCSGIGVLNPPWPQLMDTPIEAIETEIQLSRDGVAWAKGVRGLKREVKNVLLLLARHEGDDVGPFAPHPGALVVESGLTKRLFDGHVLELQQRGLVSLELRLVGGVRRSWYQLSRQQQIGVGVTQRTAEPANWDLFHVG